MSEHAVCSADFLLQVGRGIGAAGVHGYGCTKLACQFELFVIHVDCSDVCIPIALAYWTAICPRPPTPETTTQPSGWIPDTFRPL